MEILPHHVDMQMQKYHMSNIQILWMKLCKKTDILLSHFCVKLTLYLLEIYILHVEISQIQVRADMGALSRIDIFLNSLNLWIINKSGNMKKKICRYLGKIQAKLQDWCWVTLCKYYYKIKLSANYELQIWNVIKVRGELC